ncbi:hypothetical protein [Actinoplanes sp. NPDC049599]|uniref:hypothetical protein n=1 Tax=Actinoplanes sp. NPDC049599 TaxID=3363903 RepID=UPI003793CF2D
MLAVRPINPAASARACSKAGIRAQTPSRSHRYNVYDGLSSGRNTSPARKCRFVADLDGRVADVGEPVNGVRHDVATFLVSGTAGRWASRGRWGAVKPVGLPGGRIRADVVHGQITAVGLTGARSCRRRWAQS